MHRLTTLFFLTFASFLIASEPEKKLTIREKAAIGAAVHPEGLPGYLKASRKRCPCKKHAPRVADCECFARILAGLDALSNDELPEEIKKKYDLSSEESKKLGETIGREILLPLARTVPEQCGKTDAGTQAFIRHYSEKERIAHAENIVRAYRDAKNQHAHK